MIEIQADELLPECVFIEDTAVICNNIALMTKPGNQTRLQEVSFLNIKTIDLPINCITNTSPDECPTVVLIKEEIPI